MLCLLLFQDKMGIIFQSLGLLVSIGTLILAWKIMKYFQRQQISLKQLDKVTELIDYINNHRIDFVFGRSSGNMFGGDLIKMSLFELKNMNFDDSAFLSSPILLDRDSKGIIDISNFVNNPLVPSDISEELKNFKTWKGTAIYVSYLEGDWQETDEITAVIINSNTKGDYILFNKSDKDDHFYVGYSAFACEDWNNFKKCSKNLEMSIRNWLLKYNISDIKIIE